MRAATEPLASGIYTPASSAKDLERLVGAEAWARLPRAVRERFGAAAREAEYVGEGEFRANALGRFFAWIGSFVGRPLPLSTGPARILILVAPSAEGEMWRRLYSFPGRAELVRSIKRAGAGPWLEEGAGPLAMRLAVSEERGALVFDCIDFRLRFCGLDIALPLALTPGRIRVEHHDLGGGRFAFTLEARHPWFGRTFSQRCVMRDSGAFP
jgi:hypothetical protein